MMRRTELTRKTPLSSMGSTPLKRSTFKKRAPKKRVGHNATMRNACRDQQCYLAVPDVCLGQNGAATVVPCHSNDPRHGKGMGLKADDIYTVPGCMTCHSWLDQGSAVKELKRSTWESAYGRWSSVRDQKTNPALIRVSPGFSTASI